VQGSDGLPPPPLNNPNIKSKLLSTIEVSFEAVCDSVERCSQIGRWWLKVKEHSRVIPQAGHQIPSFQWGRRLC